MKGLDLISKPKLKVSGKIWEGLVSVSKEKVSFTSLPLRTKHLKSRLVWDLGIALISPSGVWDTAPAEIEFGAFKP